MRRLSHIDRHRRPTDVVLFRRALLVACFVALFPACAEKNTHDSGAPEPPVAVPGLPGGSLGSAPTEIGAPDAGAPACPGAMARVEGFCIDRYEAHLVARVGGEVAPYPHFKRPEEGVTYEARSEPGVFTQAYISRVESEAACTNAEKRLCSRREWQRACRGGLGTTYPYGPRWQPRRCNGEKPHLLTMHFGADPRRWRYAQFNDPALSQEPGFLAKTGEYDGCTGDAGVYDLVGNLHEWVSDTADSAFKARIDTEGVARGFQYWSPGNGVFMGGFYSTQGELGPGCTFTTIAHDSSYHDYSIGFRCCADPR